MFKNSYIPRTLDEVIDIERDINRAKLGDTDEVNMYRGHQIKLLILRGI